MLKKVGEIVHEWFTSVSEAKRVREDTHKRADSYHPKPQFSLHRFGTVEDVSALQAGEAVLIRNHTIRRRYRNYNSAQVSIRNSANKHGARYWMTRTVQGHMLIYRKPELIRR